MGRLPRSPDIIRDMQGQAEQLRGAEVFLADKLSLRIAQAEAAIVGAEAAAAAAAASAAAANDAANGALNAANAAQTAANNANYNASVAYNAATSAQSAANSANSAASLAYATAAKIQLSISYGSGNVLYSGAGEWVISGMSINRNVPGGNVLVFASMSLQGAGNAVLGDITIRGNGGAWASRKYNLASGVWGTMTIIAAGTVNPGGNYTFDCTVNGNANAQFSGRQISVLTLP